MTSIEYKGYVIESDGGRGMKLIKSKGKGSIPNPMKGLFTSVQAATRQIDIHGKREKEKVSEQERTSD